VSPEFGISPYSTFFKVSDNWLIIPSKDFKGMVEAHGIEVNEKVRL